MDNHTSDIPLKRCTKCGESKPATSEYFYPDPRYSSGLKSWCRPCHKNLRVHQPLLPGLKQCSQCENILPETEEFFRYRRQRQQFFAMCHECERARTADRYQANIEQQKESQRRYKEQHPERRKQTAKKWADSNLDKQRLFHQRHYALNKEEIREKQRRYDELHPEKKRARSQLRRARIRAAVGTHTSQEIRELYDLQEGRCGFCGIPVFWSIRNDVHVEHVTPLVKGGGNDIDNILIACRDCNLTKHQKTLEEWKRVRGW